METRKWFAFLLCGGVFAWLWSSPIVSAQPAPCSLLTDKQVSTALGAPVGAASPIANTGCSWKGTGSSKVMVSISLQSEKMFAGAKSSPPEAGKKTPVSGLGDDAFLTGMQGFASLWVKKGTTVILVRVYGLPAEEAHNKLKILAANALSKL